VQSSVVTNEEKGKRRKPGKSAKYTQGYNERQLRAAVWPQRTAR
jgi:hypothetical protein